MSFLSSLNPKNGLPKRGFHRLVSYLALTPYPSEPNSSTGLFQRRASGCTGKFVLGRQSLSFFGGCCHIASKGPFFLCLLVCHMFPLWFSVLSVWFTICETQLTTTAPQARCCFTNMFSVLRCQSRRRSRLLCGDQEPVAVLHLRGPGARLDQDMAMYSKYPASFLSFFFLKRTGQTREAFFHLQILKGFFFCKPGFPGPPPGPPEGFLPNGSRLPGLPST